MAAKADRHLLFGLIALQNGLIDQGQLVAAFQAWSRDPKRALADHLVERGDLEADERAGVEAMIGLHLKKHAGDIERSLAAIRTDRSTREIIKQERVRSIADASDGTQSFEGGDARDRQAGFSLGPAPISAAGQRYRILRPHARGGLGAVFVALDGELNREVALKQILDRHADDVVSRQRFLVEAEITGGLEHPGIVPVYGMGTYRDGRPFYAMRFIRGESLKEAISAFHADRSPRDDPSRRSLELRKLLRRFTDVCNAIGYAHGRGILHRDVKPGNVIVGAHGETLVVDWGLAKPIGKTEMGIVSDDETLTPSSASGSAQTLPGSAMGTPAYMSPEQAAGDLHRLGPQSDVYSLGATLYSLLTGRVPFGGDNVRDVLNRVQRGEFPRPRELDPTIDPALEAICLKAMARGIEARYPTCLDLAEDIDRWAADEPVSARAEPFVEKARRWMRHHRAAVTATAAATLMALVGTAAVLAVATRSNAALKAANHDLSIANGNERKAREQAQARFSLAMDAIRGYYTGASTDVMLREPRLKPLREKLLGSAMAFYQRVQGLLADDSSPEARATLAEAIDTAARITSQIDSVARALPGHEQALAIRETLASASPDDMKAQDDLIDSLTATSNMLSGLGRHDEAIRLAKRAVSTREALAARVPPPPGARSALASHLNTLGHHLARAGRLEEMLAADLEALRISEQVAAERPEDKEALIDLAFAYQNIGHAYQDLSRSEEARASFQKALTIREKLAASPADGGDGRDDLARTCSTLGNELFEAGRRDEALSLHRRALGIWSGLAREYPTKTKHRTDKAMALFNIAIAESALGHGDKALEGFRDSLEIRQALAKEQPEVVQWQVALARSHESLGMWKYRNGSGEEAVESLRSAISVLAPLAREQGTNVELQETLARVTYSLGEFLVYLGRDSEATEALRQFLSIAEALARAQPGSSYVKNLHSEALVSLGRSLGREGRALDALVQLDRAIEIQEQLIAEHPNMVRYASTLARTLNAYSEAREQAGQKAGALQALERALAIRESHPSDDPIEIYSLACTLARCAALADAPRRSLYADRAMTALNRCAANGFRNAKHMKLDPDLDSLRGRQDFQVLMLDLAFPEDPFARD